MNNYVNRLDAYKFSRQTDHAMEYLRAVQQRIVVAGEDVTA